MSSVSVDKKEITKTENVVNTNNSPVNNKEDKQELSVTEELKNIKTKWTFDTQKRLFNTGIVCFPHVHIERAHPTDASKKTYQKIKFNYLYKKEDGSHTNKGLMYDKLPTINTYYVIISNNSSSSQSSSSSTSTTSTTVTDIDLTKTKDTKNNVLSSFLPPVYNQGGYGTCTANATAMVWNILKLVGGNSISYNSSTSVYNTTFVHLTNTPSRSCIYYNGRSVSGLLVETISNNNSIVNDRVYVDEGADPALFGSVFNISGSPANVNETLITAGAASGTVNGHNVTYYFYGGDVITGFCSDSKWSYPVDSNYTVNSINDPYPYCNPYFLLYNSTSSNGEYDTGTLVPTNSSVTTIESAVQTKANSIQSSISTTAGTFSVLPNNSIYTMSLSPLHTVAMPSSNQSNITSSTFFQTLKQGLPMLFGFNVYSSFMNVTSTGSNAGIVPPISGSLLGGHCIVTLGWTQYPANSGKYYVKCLNSWGASWGNAGYLYFTLSIFTDVRTDGSLYAFVSAN